MLMDGPRSGYDLKGDFEEQIGHFWSESLGQIYPTLHRLRDEGKVTTRKPGRDGRAGRIMYAITAAGRAEFRAWMEEPAQSGTVRNELLLKLFFGHETPSDLMLRHLDRFEAEQTELQHLYRLFEREVKQRDVTAARRLSWQLALSSGQHVNQARLEWCAAARRMIQQYQRRERRADREAAS